jgi:lipoate synthase
MFVIFNRERRRGFHQAYQIWSLSQQLELEFQLATAVRNDDLATFGGSCFLHTHRKIRGNKKSPLVFSIIFSLKNESKSC